MVKVCISRFTFGHVRQADAVASRFVLELGERTELLGSQDDAGTVMVDIDDTIVEVHGYQKQAAAFGYSGCRASTPCWPLSLVRSLLR